MTGYMGTSSSEVLHPLIVLFLFHRLYRKTAAIPIMTRTSTEIITDANMSPCPSGTDENKKSR